MKKRSNAVRYLILFIICVSLFFTIGTVVLTKYDKKVIDPDILLASRQTVIYFDNVEIKPVSGQLTDAKGKEIRFQENSNMVEIKQNDFLGTIVFLLQPKSATITLRHHEVEEFTGTLETFDAFIPQYDGEYLAEMIVLYDTKEFSGECEYGFIIDYDAPSSFILTNTDVTSGDALLLIGKNIRVQDVSVSLDYPFSPHITYNQDGDCISFIPINHLRTTGLYHAIITNADTQTELTYNVSEPDFTVQYLSMPNTTIDSTIGNSEAQDEYNSILIPLFESYDDNVYWNSVFIQPVNGEVTTDYGIKRYTNDNPNPSRHAGIDIATAIGTPIAAANAGKILFAGELIMTGYTVLIEHGMGLHTLYLHMDSIRCETGDFMNTGDIVGTVGMSGYATGPHLHFEVMIGFQSINPWMMFNGTSGVYALHEYTK